MLGKLLAWLRPAPRQVNIPQPLWQTTIDALPFLGELDEEEGERLQSLCEQFLASKEFASADGAIIDDAARVAIAAQGCLPILNLGLSWYRGWVGIVLYPDEFVIARQSVDEFGIVHEFDDVVSGEAWEGGPLILSWQDAQLAGGGYNVIIHEFAHKLDMLNGDADGLPPLHQGMSRQAWCDCLEATYADFCQQVDAAEAEGIATAIDAYGAASPAEFFAVSSETFFELPGLLHAEYPDWYAQLAAFYRQEPLLRQQRAESGERQAARESTSR